MVQGFIYCSQEKQCLNQNRFLLIELDEFTEIRSPIVRLQEGNFVSHITDGQQSRGKRLKKFDLAWGSSKA